jgi:outer membrane immunogenic protein
MNTKFLALMIGAATLGAVQQSKAADLPAAPVPYNAPATLVERAYNWQGAYVGINAGYGAARIRDTSVGNTGDSSNFNGPFVGGQLGAQFQTAALVYGIEGDFQASWQSRSQTTSLFGVGITGKEEIPWFGTVRGRIGYAFDRNLLYVTAGGAYTNFKLSVTAVGLTISANDSQFGWTAGGGWEWAFADKWSAKFEYLYIDTGTVNFNLAGTIISGKLTDHIGRAGVNYHF